MNDRDSARRLHESTKHGTPPTSPASLVDYRRLDPRNAPRPFKEYLGIGRIPLPRRLVVSALPATAVLSGETGADSSIDSSLLATLLFLSAGVTRMMGPPGRRMYFRAAMSAGNLHPIEVYLAVGEDGVVGVDPGLYHFAPLEFALTRLREVDCRGWLGINGSLGIILTGIPWRTTWKYAERGWRHLYWDSGTMLANLLAVADAHGLRHRTRLGFDDDLVAETLGIDGAGEMPLAIVDLGDDGGVGTSSAPELDSMSVDVAPLAPQPIRLPLLQAAQLGSALSSERVGEWLQTGSLVAHPATSEVPALVETDDAIEEVILRRGSTRRMVHRTIEREHLEWSMAAATRTVGADVIPDGTLVDHYLNVHAVRGMGPGAYLYREDKFDLIRSQDRLREQSAALCLGQPLGGDSCYTVFHCADLEPILDALGSRGYRVAQFESGVVSGRLALCAFASGLGATGLTFFDNAVSQFFGTTAQPMLVTSVGVPASQPAPAGDPGQPALLSR